MTEKEFIEHAIESGFGNGTLKYIDHLKKFGKRSSIDQVKLYVNSTLLDSKSLWESLGLNESDYIKYKLSVYNNTDKEDVLQEIYNKTLCH